MSTDERPGMAINEDKIEQHVRETKQQARRANYPAQPTPLHEKAPARRNPGAPQGRRRGERRRQAR